VGVARRPTGPAAGRTEWAAGRHWIAWGPRRELLSRHGLSTCSLHDPASSLLLPPFTPFAPWLCVLAPSKPWCLGDLVARPPAFSGKHEPTGARASSCHAREQQQRPSVAAAGAASRSRPDWPRPVRGKLPGGQRRQRRRQQRRGGPSRMGPTELHTQLARAADVPQVSAREGVALSTGESERRDSRAPRGRGLSRVVWSSMGATEEQDAQRSGMMTRRSAV